MSSAPDLLAAVYDRLRVNVIQNGKRKGGRIPAGDLTAMLRSEVFLGAFPPVDSLVAEPWYLPDWELTRPSYNDGGPGSRFYFAGRAGPVHPDPEAVRRFLGAMAFATEADATNAVAAALTVLLRNHWPGAKPWFPVSANRSHAGKGTWSPSWPVAARPSR